MAINLNGKKTSLDEKASIYEKRQENLTEKEKWKNMDGKQKRAYFSTYYLPKLAVICVILAVAGYIFWMDFIRKSDIYFHCAVLNDSIMDESFEEFSDAMTESFGMDPDKNKASFYVYYTQNMRTGQTGVKPAGDLSELSSRIATGIMDAVIADSGIARSYLDSGVCMKLTDFLTEEEQEKLKDVLYETSTAKDGSQAAYGISLDESSVYQSLYKGNAPFVEKPILFVITNSEEEHREYIHQVIHYLFPDRFPRDSHPEGDK